MRTSKLDQLIDQVENYIECWKQFNSFVTLARAKKFSPEDENQFLETKSVLIQQLELILAAIENGPVTDESKMWVWSRAISGTPRAMFQRELIA